MQGVIARMAGNSAYMKTWSVVLVTAAFVFSGLSDEPSWLVGLGGCVPVIAFWAMDAKYLHLERCYIKLYETVANGGSVKPFELNYRPYASSAGSVWSVAWSWSVFWYYGALLVIMIALSLVLVQMA